MERSEYRRYDPRLKNFVAASDDIRKFLKFGILLSTLREWKKNGVREFFTIPELDLTTSDLMCVTKLFEGLMITLIAGDAV